MDNIIEGVKYFYLMGAILALAIAILLHPILRSRHDNKK